MSRRIPISHAAARRLGWTRTDPRPWSSRSPGLAVWSHRSGWTIRHAGAARCHRPWQLVGPVEGCRGAELAGNTYPQLAPPMELIAALEPVDLGELVAVHVVAGERFEVRVAGGAR